MRIPFEALHTALKRSLSARGMSSDRADQCARLFAEASRDGVASHGLNRFPRFLAMIDNGSVDVAAEPSRVQSFGALERWDGHRGPGNLNAWACMARAVDLARAHGIGAVALANTNHWMRGGAYGWQAADAGVAAVCWTNTLANLPPWGAADPRIGNNPLVVAVPRAGGAVVLDMAMSQFSVGGLMGRAARGERLPVAGGYDAQGRLTDDPQAILDSQRLLPIGYWKGSGLSLMLDLLAASVSGGQATHQIATDPERETGLSQMFVTFAHVEPIADAVLAHFHGAAHDARHPGERTLETRARSLCDGVEVDEAVWRQVTVALESRRA
jgi:3-dehydro-L-gulonate 2-dehydrogenase